MEKLRLSPFLSDNKSEIAVADATSVAYSSPSSTNSHLKSTGKTTTSFKSFLQQQESISQQSKLQGNYEALRTKSNLGGTIPLIYTDLNGSLISFDEYKKLNSGTK